MTNIKRTDLFTALPEDLVIITDTAHPLYDPRIDLPLNESLVKNIMIHGILEPVIVRRNGDLYEVVDGRQRVRACLEANSRLEEQGGQPIRVPFTLKRGKDSELFAMSISANEQRTADEMLTKARKASKMVNMGYDYDSVGDQFGVAAGTVVDWLKLLECSSNVQASITTGQIKAAAAIELSKLTHEEQDKQLSEMLETGEVTAKKVREKIKGEAPKKLSLKGFQTLMKEINANMIEKGIAGVCGYCNAEMCDLCMFNDIERFFKSSSE